MARARISIPGASSDLDGAWALTSTSPGLLQPEDAGSPRLEWIACDGPMPAAAALRAAGRWNLDVPRDFDAEDWWFRCRFPGAASTGPVRLVFEGLATIADVWLNRRHLLHSNNMFVAHAVDVTPMLEPDNELLLCCHALSPMLAGRHPRPRWRTALVADQALRFYRTTLLGRIREWCPKVAPVGPWRPVRLESGPLHIDRADVRTEIDGADGLVRVTLHLSGVFAGPVRGQVATGETTSDFAVRQLPGACELTASLPVTRPERWWPHTHGHPHRYPVQATIVVDREPTEIDLGSVGFRTLSVDRDRDSQGFGFVVNGTPVFCRGVCWTPLDLPRLSAGRDEYRAALEQIRDAGMNMVRVGGTMTYEPDCFHDLCSELGLLVWQDLMFANMDYPWDDASFAQTASREVVEVVSSLQSHPSSAIVCGNSEVEQQAAMLGLPAERRRTHAAAERLADIVQAAAPDLPWLPSTPTGGTLPFQPNAGVSHYYGVGAYRRPFDDARRAQVRFAAECLGFSNVPEPASLGRMFKPGEVDLRDPRWKAGVPRDPASSWTFEEVRDHYVAALFGVDPSEIRDANPERLLAFGRIATGEAMLRTFAEWRRPESSCRGGLVWFARDLRPGAGWGIIDAIGRPKSAYWYLKRVLAPVALLAIDEGLNGLWLHAVNDTDRPVEADLRVVAYCDGRQAGAAAYTRIAVPARESRAIHADALFDGFRDLTHAYGFGPAAQDAVCATLRQQARQDAIARACWAVGRLPAEHSPGDLRARVELDDDGYVLVLEADRFIRTVSIELEDFLPLDNYVHLEPGEPVRVPLRPLRPGSSPRGIVTAVTMARPVRVAFAEPSEVG